MSDLCNDTKECQRAGKGLGLGLYAARGVVCDLKLEPWSRGVKLGSPYSVKGTAWHLTPHPLAVVFISFISGKILKRLQLHAIHSPNSSRVCGQVLLDILAGEGSTMETDLPLVIADPWQTQSDRLMEPLYITGIMLSTQ